MSVVKAGFGLVLLAAVMLGGCASLSSSTPPFNPAQSCQAVGGSYSNGTCRAGNA
jgi:hypothetical protein